MRDYIYWNALYTCVRLSNKKNQVKNIFQSVKIRYSNFLVILFLKVKSHSVFLAGLKLASSCLNLLSAAITAVHYGKKGWILAGAVF